MAETFFYSCGEFPLAFVLPAAFADVACSSAVWASAYTLTGRMPAHTAAAYALLRILLAVAVYCWQRNGVTEWLCRRMPAGWSWTGVQAAAASKVDMCYTGLTSETPVRFSMMCCNNPAMLSRIAAVSSKDLEPVRVERLSYSGGPGADLGIALPERRGSAAACASPNVDGTEAYELARRLVSSAGAGGSDAGGDEAAAGNNRGYTSAARKVRVCVKIPDRSPEELPASWDGGLQIDGQRDAAVVLFTYMRRGCVQLVFDLFGHRPAAALTGPEQRQSSPLPSPPPPPEQGLGSGSGSNGLGRDVLQLGVDGAAVVTPAVRAGGGGFPSDKQPQAAAAVEPVLTSPAVTRAHLLRVVQDERLLAGRTLTVQVGPSVSLVRMADASAGGAVAVGSGSGCDGSGADAPSYQWSGAAEGEAHVAAPPAPPPDVGVWPQVVCTAGGWWQGCFALHTRAQAREVIISCSWEAHDASLAHGADRPDAPWGTPTSSRPPPELQLTARQQGHFLPVVAGPACGSAAVGGPKFWREGLARGAVAAAVDGQFGVCGPNPQEVASSSKGGAGGGAVSACRLAFAPVRFDGLVQVELSRGGVHSVAPACVLLVSSAAVVSELQQVLATAAGSGGGDGMAGLGAASNDALAAAQKLLRDFGAFMDVAAAVVADAAGGALFADGAGALQPGCAAPPTIAWSLPAPAVPGTAPYATHVALRTAAVAAPSGGAGCTGSACAPSGKSRDHDGEWALERRRQHVCAVASLGSRLGFNLLRHFLSSGLPSCAAYVLDALEEQLGVPASLVAQYTCPEGMSLLHHAARSGAFGTVAALAGWLEARGCAPDWAAASADGLSPLHLLAVAPGCCAAAAATQLRWRGAQRAWHAAAPPPRGCGSPPAEFAAMAAGPAAAARWQRATGAAAALGVGAAWRAAAAARLRLVPRATVRASWDLLAPALRFKRAALEAEYKASQARRAVQMDVIFLGMYTAYCASQAAKEGWAFFRGHAAGLILLAWRLLLLALSSPAWGYMGAAVWRLRARLRVLRLRRRSVTPPQPSGGSEDRRPAASSGCSGGVPEPADSGDDLAGHGKSRPRPRPVLTHEGKSILLESLRSLVMLCLAAGLLPTPDSWRVLLRLRLDWLFNIVIRPTAYQLRVLPSALSSAAALVGEASVTAKVVWEPTNLAQAVRALALSLARGLTTHGLGLVFTVLYQASARRAFLVQCRPRRKGQAGGGKGAY